MCDDVEQPKYIIVQHCVGDVSRFSVLFCYFLADGDDLVEFHGVNVAI